MQQQLRKIFFILSFLMPIVSYGWGRKGHALIAELAFKNMSPSTQKTVLAYLDGLSIEEAANWMDLMRDDPAYDYLKPLHYVNVPKGEAYNKQASGNILSEITRIMGDFDKLSSLSDEAIRMDLYEIIHLIGDLHQPLHVGYADDKGGNNYQVQFEGKGSNLHRVWDSEIIEYKNISLEDLEAVQTGEGKKSIDLYRWFNESRGYLDQVYPDGHRIEETYINASVPIIESQLAKAGLRLALVLEHYFKNFKRTPNFTKSTVQIREISISQVNAYIGQTVRIHTKVFGTKQLSSITFLNCGAEYPDAPLTAVVFKDDLSGFKNNPAQFYNQKEVEITGKLELYKGKPEIILRSESQVEIK